MKTFRVGIGQISVEFGQAQRLAGFQAQGLVGLGFRDWLVFLLRGWLGFVLNWSRAEFLGSGFRVSELSLVSRSVYVSLAGPFPLYYPQITLTALTYGLCPYQTE